ncbi:MAG: nucleotidyltransferase domain-containing protein [Curtobacterium sp.]
MPRTRRPLLRPLAQRTYIRIERGPLRPLLELRVIQRVRTRWKRVMTDADVVAVADALDAAEVRWWVAGGWAVDAVVGRQTRPHEDLDLVVDRPTIATAVAVLQGLGFTHVRPDPDGRDRFVPEAFLKEREVVQDRSGRLIDLHPVDLPGWPDGMTADEAFARGRVGARAVPVLSAALQLRARHGPMRAKDDADVRLLHEAARPHGGDR